MPMKTGYGTKPSKAKAKTYGKKKMSGKKRRPFKTVMSKARSY